MKGKRSLITSGVFENKADSLNVPSEIVIELIILSLRNVQSFYLTVYRANECQQLTKHNPIAQSF